MKAEGFSLVELLVATCLCAALAGAAALVVAPARRVLAATPVAVDVDQRARTALDQVTMAIRNAGGEGAVGPRAVPLASVVPAVMPSGAPRGSDEAFESMFVIASTTSGGRGVLAVDQPGPSGLLTLAPSGACPSWRAPCGFSEGKTAVVADGLGRFDIVTIAAVFPGAMQVRAARPLSAAYRAGAIVVEASADRFSVRGQADGSQALSRVTAAGATQPMVDSVTEVGFEFWAAAGAPVVSWVERGGWASYGPPPADPSAEAPSCAALVVDGTAISLLSSWGDENQLVRIHAADLADGPWCWSGPNGPYDLDVFRIVRVDAVIGFEPPPSVLRRPGRVDPSRVVRVSTALRNR